MAFVHGGVVAARSASRTAATCGRQSAVMSAEKRELNVSRRQALTAILGIGAVSVVGVDEAKAAGGFVFPKPGFNGKKLKPGDLEVDQDALKSKDVQSKLQELRALREKIAKLSSDFAGNSQLDVVTRANELVDISVLRTDLNTINTVFDEDTQIKTDRVVRAVIQDINEIKGVGQLKANQTRSEKKATNTANRISKLEQDLDKLLQFYP